MLGEVLIIAPARRAAGCNLIAPHASALQHLLPAWYCRCRQQQRLLPWSASLWALLREVGAT